MSNRLVQVGRVPLIPDPQTALKASQVFFSTRDQAGKVVELGAAYLELLAGIWTGLRRFADRLDRAVRIRNLSMMTDAGLADIGLRRDQLPQLYVGRGFDAKTERRASSWLTDSER